MQAKYTWLLLPPALALVLFLGPFGATKPARDAEPPQTSSAPDTPASPTIEQITSTLLGVLLVGGAAVVGLARWQGRRASGSTGDVVRLRQSLRLSGRQAIHAVEFDGQLLLLGECDANVAVLRATAAETDLEAEERFPQPGTAAAAIDDADEGATPRDLLIPRPARAATTRAAAAPTKSAEDPQLADFRALLKLARQGAGAQ